MDPSLMTGSASNMGTAVPANTKRIIRSAVLYNGTVAPVVCEIHCIPSGGTASDTNRVIHRTLAVEETYTCPELVNKGMNAAGFVQGLGLDVSFSYTATDITNA
jgi:hypothetical protein